MSQVIDGDTLVADRDGREERIRLCGVDAPKQDQPLAAEATALLEDLVLDEFVVLVPVERDRYGHLVAEIFVLPPEGTDTPELFVQQELLTTGLVWVYPPSVRDCLNGEVMEVLEAIAREENVGVWAEPGSVPPWEWRQR